MTVHRESKFKIAPASVQRFKKKLRPLLRRTRGRNFRGLLTERAPILRGWAAYFRLSAVKVTWELLDQRQRRKRPAILWKQWKTWRARLRELVRLGLARERAAASASKGRGTWWNAGVSHKNEAVPNALLPRWVLVSLQQEQRRLDRNL